MRIISNPDDEFLIKKYRRNKTIPPKEPFFGQRYTQIIHKPHSFARGIQQVDDILKLENGKTFERYEYRTKDNALFAKIQLLKDKTGKWLKSKLKYFSNGKVIKLVRSEINA